METLDLPLGFFRVSVRFPNNDDMVDMTVVCSLRIRLLQLLIHLLALGSLEEDGELSGRCSPEVVDLVVFVFCMLPSCLGVFFPNW